LSNILVLDTFGNFCNFGCILEIMEEEAKPAISAKVVLNLKGQKRN
jgi:hypothetical protein